MDLPTRRDADVNHRTTVDQLQGARWRSRKSVSCQDECSCCCGDDNDGDWVGSIGDMTTATRLFSWHCSLLVAAGEMHHERVGGCQIKFAAKLKGGR